MTTGDKPVREDQVRVGRSEHQRCVPGDFNELERGHQQGVRLAAASSASKQDLRLKIQQELSLFEGGLMRNVGVFEDRCPEYRLAFRGGQILEVHPITAPSFHWQRQFFSRIALHISPYALRWTRRLPA